jgi:hypothetical protein
MTFCVSKWTFVGWYALVGVVTSGFAWILHHIWQDIPLLVLGFLACILIAAWILPLPLIRSCFTISSEGISQIVPFGGKYRWSVRWDEIGDWSHVEIASMTDGGYWWQPHVFVSAHRRIHETHYWIVGAKEAKAIAAELMSHCGPPKDAENPIVPIIWGLKQKWRHPQEGSNSLNPTEGS